MAEKACVKRLQKEYRALCKEPVSNIVARPSPNNILEWHYVLEGSEGTPFAGGYYYGKIKFPPEYPYKPPAISPSGELEPYVVGLKHSHRIALIYGFSLALAAFLFIFPLQMDNSPTTGGVTTTTAEKEKLAKASLASNCKNPTFRKLFPEYVEKYQQQQHQQLASQSVSEQASPTSTQQENSRLLEGNSNINNGDLNGVEPPQEMRNRRKKAFPTWLLLLVFSVFGIVMALPLLQL
nr:ubiquitin-conjugating enzyme E2 34-like [Ipomoea batatas]